MSQLSDIWGPLEQAEMQKDSSQQSSEIELVKNIIQTGTELGIVLENIEFRIGKNGIEAHKISMQDEFRIYVPEEFIIDINKIVWTDTIPHINETMSDKKREFFDFYFKLIWSNDRKNQILVSIKHLQDHKNLYKDIGLNQLIKFENSNYNMNRLITSMYSIGYTDTNNIRRPSLMPVMDFINHSASGLSYFNARPGLELSGVSNKSEICAQYNLSDPIGQYSTYLFSEKANVCYSLPISMPLRDGRILIIQRNLSKNNKNNENFHPIITEKENKIIFSFLTISNKEYPLKPVNEFLQFASKLNINNAFLIWDRIRARNFGHLWEIHNKLQYLGPEDRSSAMENCISDQLTSMSY